MAVTALLLAGLCLARQLHAAPGGGRRLQHDLAAEKSGLGPAGHPRDTLVLVEAVSVLDLKLLNCFFRFSHGVLPDLANM